MDRGPVFRLLTLMTQCPISIIYILKVSLEWEVSLSLAPVNGDIALYHLAKLLS